VENSRPLWEPTAVLTGRAAVENRREEPRVGAPVRTFVKNLRICEL
jgi:hypothetical protein